MDKRYLVDTNFLVQAERYYPQDIFPSFWERLRENIEDGTIALHVTVLEEVYKNEDDLADWMKSVPKFTPVEISEKAFNKYLELCAWAKDPRQGYSQAAIATFEDNHHADAWICAECAVSGFVLVTNERRSNTPNNVKIPNVCDAFQIECMSVFDFMRLKNFKF